ncbi:MAG: translation elongation factor Ts [Deltaproteobacteria bacterium]|jgi:elongation factor Ts|nr:translation elongation factor Ts [Deltaproteobacteria bacterium]
MAAITATLVKDLRERTGAGMMDCKKALEETSGNFELAIEWLQKKQLASAGKKSGRIAADGVVASYLHQGGRIGVLVEVNCETDFVARNEDFLAFSKDIAMHIAATNPLVVRAEELSADVVAKQEEIFTAQAMNEGKPENIAKNIVVGRLKKWKAESCLLDQPFVKDPDKTVAALVAEVTAKIGEKISIRRFARFEVGEGIEKRQDDFAAEVAKQVAG